MALIFALSCCFCTAINDLVFRLYARKSRSRGAYVLIIGVVWTVLFLTFLKLNFETWKITLFWGIVSGLFSVVANILLIEGMSHNDAGICATIYRLNLILVALGAFMLLGETVTFIKILGILFAFSAIFMFFLDAPRDGHNSKAKLGLILVGIAALLRAGMGLSYKYAFTEGADRNSVLVLNGILWIVGGAVYLIYREKHLGEKFGQKSWRYGMISGLLVCGIIYFMALALQHGDAAVVLPLAQMSFIATFGLGILFLKEKLSRKKAIGIIAGVLCILCMSIAI
ncbi:MAG: GRP family sugar transporter [Victivallaceae bacterium]|nr:GRP family sugar transporter [Victivallaceae bacterium]